MLTVHLDGRTVRAPHGATILETARKEGVDIPTLCHCDDVPSPGTCRVCLVEVDGPRGPELVASCRYPVREGLRVRTNTERVRRVRRGVVELHLARSPDAAAVRQLARRLGVDGPRLTVCRDDCLLCGRCVEVCRDVVGACALGFLGRGADRRVGVPEGTHFEACLGCGACTYVCPTGAIQMEAQAVERFRRRAGGRSRLCRLSRLGLVSHRLCSHNFECWHCEFDQSVEDFFGTHPALVLRPAARRELRSVGAFLFAPEYEYGPGHLWTEQRDGFVRVGLDDLARRLLGPVEEVRPVHRGMHGGPGSISAIVRGRGRRVALLSFPLTGSIASINPLLASDPSVPFKDPYRRGWLFDLEPDPDAPPSEGRCRGEEAVRWFRSETERLSAAAGPLGRDGDFWMVPASMAFARWRSLARSFLFPRREKVPA